MTDYNYYSMIVHPERSKRMNRHVSYYIIILFKAQRAISSNEKIKNDHLNVIKIIIMEIIT